MPCSNRLGLHLEGQHKRALHAQVKHVLNQQDTAGTREQDGPLAEISFWQHQGDNLSGIRLQLDSAGEPSYPPCKP